MFMMCGYNFCKDGNALDPAPILTNNFKTVRLTNGIFDHWNVTRDVNSDYTPDIPTAWDYLTVMDANFNGNIVAGNATFSLASIDGIKIKRRRTSDFDWVAIRYLPASEITTLSFTLNDNLAASGEQYEYAFVPVVGGVEGDYITETISTKFDGVFICDLDTIYKFYAGVKYGTNERVQKIGIFEPYGRKYPVVVSNGLINYETGSVTGTVLADDYLKTKAMNRIAMVKEQKALKDFLTNKKAKILKDWNSHSWLMFVTDSISTSYDDKYGMGIADVSFDWTEIGDSNNQADLYNNGLTEVSN